MEKLDRATARERPSPGIFYAPSSSSGAYSFSTKQGKFQVVVELFQLAQRGARCPRPARGLLACRR